MRTSFQAAATTTGLARAAVLLALLSTLPVGAHAGWQAPPQTRTWSEVRSPQHGFSIQFPAPATQGTMESGEIRWTVALDNGWTAYFMSVSDLSDERVRTAGAKGVLDGAVQGGISRFPAARVVRHTSIQIGGNPGRELVLTLEMQGTTMRIENRVFLVNTRLYVFNAVVRESAYDRAELDRFLNSFALISG